MGGLESRNVSGLERMLVGRRAAVLRRREKSWPLHPGSLHPGDGQAKLPQVHPTCVVQLASSDRGRDSCGICRRAGVLLVQFWLERAWSFLDPSVGNLSWIKKRVTIIIKVPRVVSGASHIFELTSCDTRVRSHTHASVINTSICKSRQMCAPIVQILVAVIFSRTDEMRAKCTIPSPALKPSKECARSFQRCQNLCHEFSAADSWACAAPHIQCARLRRCRLH